jgi:hypothetical protein
MKEDLREDPPEAKGQRQIAGLRAEQPGGARQTKLVLSFLSALARDGVPAVLGGLSSTAAITLGDNDVLRLAELAGQLDGATVTKINGAGSTVAISLNSGHGRGITDLPLQR